MLDKLTAPGSGEAVRRLSSSYLSVAAAGTIETAAAPDVGGRSRDRALLPGKEFLLRFGCDCCCGELDVLVFFLYLPGEDKGDTLFASSLLPLLVLLLSLLLILLL